MATDQHGRYPGILDAPLEVWLVRVPLATSGTVAEVT
jgi:hypothetical protein